MSENKDDDWCIVRWHDGETRIYREYQWYVQAKNYAHKWDYVAKGLTEKQAKEFLSLFKE